MKGTASSSDPIVRPIRTTSIAVVLMVEGEPLESLADGVAEKDWITHLIVVGKDPRTKQQAEQLGALHRETLDEVTRALPADIEYVWILAGQARPQPGSLTAMVQVAENHQVALVGSKILSTEDSEQLLSVGSATDLFGVTFSGLDDSELDFAQYDVVREVSNLSSVSLLVRRRLLAVLGGFDELLPPVSAGLDFCQRVRLAGGRVVVAPSSRVLYPSGRFPRFAGWRERAGRMRAMFKVYRLMTLAWAIPLDVLLNLGEGLFRLVLGRPGRLAGFIAAVGWNIWRFPSTVSARLKSQKFRAVGDEDIFRYQMSGSVTLREVGSEIGRRIGDFGPEDKSWAAVMTSRLRQGAPWAALLSLLYLAAASRNIWLSGLPSVGFTFAPGDDPGGVLAAYAGGWNETGLGSAFPPHPAAVLAASVDWLTLEWSGSQILLTAVALLAGLVGSARLLRTMGISAAGSYAGAVIYLLGSTTASVLLQGYWPMVIALGAFPWSVASAVRPWPPRWRSRIGDLAAISLACAVLAVSAPVAVAAPVAVVILGCVAGVGWSWWSVPRVVAGAVVGISAVGAYLWANDLDVWSYGPSLAWEADWNFWAGVALAGLLTLAFGGPRLRGAAGLGLALVGVGLWVGDLPEWEVALAGALLAAVGAGATAAAAVAAGGKEAEGRSRLGAMLTLVAGVVLVGFTLPVLEGGRVGLPEDQWSGTFDFASSLADPVEGSRLLLIGPEGSLPGMERRGEGFSYRLVKSGPPTLEQAWLAPPGVGDQALAEVMAELYASRPLRPGELLAPFGVRWVVASRETGFSDGFSGQVDLRILAASEEAVVYENLVARPRSDGPYVGAWDSIAPDRVGGPEFQGRIRIGDNAHHRWGPEWIQHSWWNTISGAEGAGYFTPDPWERRMAWWGAGLIIVLAGLVWWGRGALR